MDFQCQLPVNGPIKTSNNVCDPEKRKTQLGHTQLLLVLGPVDMAVGRELCAHTDRKNPIKIKGRLVDFFYLCAAVIPFRSPSSLTNIIPYSISNRPREGKTGVTDLIRNMGTFVKEMSGDLGGESIPYFHRNEPPRERKKIFGGGIISKEIWMLTATRLAV